MSHLNSLRRTVAHALHKFKAERLGGAESLREHYQVNRNKLFQDIVRNPPERILTGQRRTFEDLLK